MAELMITFSGICTHLHDNVVPGVPMRTVLPDALAVRFGLIRIPGLNGFHDVEYYLMPHIPLIRDRLRGGRHLWLQGSYLKIVNAKPQPFCFESDGFSLTQFKKDVELSPEVVFGGYAAAYFDFFGGRVWSEGGDGEPRITKVCVKTEGTPRLSISPLPGSLTSISTEVPIESGELYVTNLDLEAAAEDTQFDFLLNYLVARGGIPRELHELTPGMHPDPKALTMAHLGERLKALGTLIETQGTVSGWQAAIKGGFEPGTLDVGPRLAGDFSIGTIAKSSVDPVTFDPSCSDSNFP